MGLLEIPASRTPVTDFGACKTTPTGGHPFPLLAVSIAGELIAAPADIGATISLCSPLHALKGQLRSSKKISRRLILICAEMACLYALLYSV